MRLFVILTTVSAVIAIPLPVWLKKRSGYDAGAVYPRGTFDAGTDITAPTTGYSTPVKVFHGGYSLTHDIPDIPITQPPSTNYNPNANDYRDPDISKFFSHLIPQGNGLEIIPAEKPLVEGPIGGEDLIIPLFRPLRIPYTGSTSHGT